MAAAGARTGAGRAGQGRLLSPCDRRAGLTARSGCGAPTLPCPGFHSAAGGSASGIPAAAATAVQVSRGAAGESRSPGADRTPPSRAWPDAGKGVRAAPGRGGVSAASALPRAYLAGTTPAPPRQGRGGRGGAGSRGRARGSERAGSPRGSRTKLRQGERRRRQWAPFQRSCVRAGRLPTAGLGRAEGGGAEEPRGE